jgi:hypothetical protein
MSKAIRTIYTVFLTLFFIGSLQPISAQVAQQDPTNLVQESNIKLDKLGNATIELTQKMNAAQWENFRQSALMNDVAIAKRNLERSMSTYLISDFKRDIDEMNRSVKMTVTITGYAQYDGDDNWEAKSDTKNPQVTKISDNVYMVLGNTVLSGNLVQQITKIYFPDGSKDVQQTTDAFGNTIYTYKLGGGLVSVMSWNNILGALLILSSIILFIRTQSPVPKQKTA